VNTGRLEAFSDGVIAVAITLLVLGISVPGKSSRHSFAHQLLHQWPEYAAFVISFLTIGIIWINHHSMITRLRVADHTILLLNLVLLMTISILPFATDLVAEHLEQPVAAAVYAAAFLVMALAFSFLNRYILLARPHYLGTPLSAERRRQILHRSLTGLVPYAIAVPLAFVSSYITLAICAALAVFYTTPAATGRDIRDG